MALYIANCTKQHYKHCFRAPESGRAQMVEVPSGQQQVVGHNWNAAQTDAVIKHLEMYGGRPATDKKLDNFHGLLYSIDKPIKDYQIVDGHDAVVDRQEKTAASEATKSALGFDAANRDKKNRKKRNAKMTQVTVEQDIPRNEKPTGKEVKFDLSVSDDGSDSVKLPN